jgi:cysteine desulfurase
MTRPIYMDHAATTPVRKETLSAMQPFFSDNFGNASSLYDLGRKAKEALDESRKKIARIINAEPQEIIFTSGGTESDNMAVKEIAFANRNKGSHIITSSFEHHAVINTCKFLEKNGFKVDYVNPDKYGIINPRDIEKLITEKTILVSIMHANNEIGTIQPIEEIGKICKDKKIIFHTDAVQTFCRLPVDVKKMNIDLLSASGHKIYGPKGAGFLFIRKGTGIFPLLHGGGQESGLRSGTENIPGIVGMAKSAELAGKETNSENSRLAKLRDILIKEILKIPGTRLNGHASRRLANNANFSFQNIEGESIVMLLDKAGIAASTGSACSTKSLEPSHVLLAIGLSHKDAHGSLRLTLGKSNNEKDIKTAIREIKKIVNQLRKISPFQKIIE